jgi:osmoprotectant transport system permease protein
VVVVALAFPVLGFGTRTPRAGAGDLLRDANPARTVAALEAGAGRADAARAMGLHGRAGAPAGGASLALPVHRRGGARGADSRGLHRRGRRARGASTLGTPIIIGLQNQNEVYILQGAAATGALAFAVDGLLLLALGALGPPPRRPDASCGATVAPR